jgi:hypothetical protein
MISLSTARILISIFMTCKLVFDHLKEANMTVKPSKCCFCREELPFLGHIITKEGIKPDPAKVEKMLHCRPPPVNVKEVQQFLGLAGNYRRFIRHFADITAPLDKLKKKAQPWEWGSEQQQAFDTLRTALITEPILIFPNFKLAIHCAF